MPELFSRLMRCTSCQVGLLLLLVLGGAERASCDGSEARAPNAPESQEDATVQGQAAPQRQDWWSLRPVADPAVPEVGDRDWSDHPIDRFVLAKLAERGIRPAPRADRTTLARRLAYAITGLPPTPAQVETFLTDSSPEAWQTLVDSMLASPHFGERWARHWMDVVRYTDTYGYEWDIPAKGSWRYRDYLIRAFNGDVPFDQLVREQIAGDLLEQPRVHPVEQTNESLAGLMFFQMGEKRHGDSSEFNGIHQEMLDNKIDAFGKAFQAMTISCARCHDHKLDAIAQREYYALAGVFMSSRWVTNTLDLPGRHQLRRRELQEIKDQLRPLLARTWLQDVEDWSVETWRKQVEARGDKAPTLDDPLYPWWKYQSAAESGGAADAWRELANEYGQAQERRTQNNVGHFSLVADFRQGIPAGWSVDGVGLSELVPCGDFTVALDGASAVSQILHGGLVTHSLSPRMNGAVRTPYWNSMEPGHLSFELSGGDFAARRTVIDNAFLTEKQHYVNQRQPTWHFVEQPADVQNRRVYVELATKTSNPNFPPRVGLGGECSEQQVADPKSWFGVSRVVRHHAPFSPTDELGRFSGLFDGQATHTLEQAVERYRTWFRRAIEAWTAQRASDDDVRLINCLLDRGLLTNRSDGDAAIGELVGRYRAVEQAMPLPWTVNGMADLDRGFDYALNLRGDYDTLGDPVPRGYLSLLAGAGHRFESLGSGRHQLAEYVSSRDNPLTARVFVNRVWNWLFGTGIVATPDDFGHAGGLPSHPELLDYLAARFMADGWSLKRLVRTLVLTETWRQSGRSSGTALAADPDNRLLHHYPLRRIEAESVRDAILFVSGRLDASLYGPPIDPHRQNEDAQKRLFSGPLDGGGRRSLYVKVTIMEPPRFLAAFNQPAPKIPTGRRDVTNTPAQALALLNDPFVTAQAAHWAERLVAASETTLASRLSHMFHTALGRQPTAQELDRWSAAVVEFAALRGLEIDQCLESVPVWSDVAHVIFNLKEFMYVR
jgi:hypothetical protein